MYFATDVNKELAGHEVDRITADRGTAHMPALLEAISLKPDVIYFLTDGDEPELSPAQLAEIRRLAGSLTIHVIKFGDGTLSSRGPIMARTSRQPVQWRIPRDQHRQSLRNAGPAGEVSRAQ